MDSFHDHVQRQGFGACVICAKTVDNTAATTVRHPAYGPRDFDVHVQCKEVAARLGAR